MRKKINIGSVSHGTMRKEDLIPAFIDALREQKPLRREHRKLIRNIDEHMPTDDDLNDLFDALNEYALPYFYFGSHPGNESDYGFWLYENWQYDFDGIIESSNGMHTTFSQYGYAIDGIPKGYTGSHAVINDHGNVSMYRVTRGRSRELWSIV